MRWSTCYRMRHRTQRLRQATLPTCTMRCCCCLSICSRGRTRSPRFALRATPGQSRASPRPVRGPPGGTSTTWLAAGWKTRPCCTRTCCATWSRCCRCFAQRRLQASPGTTRQLASGACAPSRLDRSADVQLSAAEFDRIGFVFAVMDRPAGYGNARALMRHAVAHPPDSTRLSDVAPAFAGGVQKSISLATAREWLTHACCPPPPPGAPPRGGDYVLEGASRTTVVVRDVDVAASGVLRLANCSELLLYALAPCALATLVGCTDCTLVLGAVSRALRMENCARCSVTVAARGVQLRGCVGGVLHAAVARPTLALGDTRGVVLAPYCTHYDALGRHLAAAGLSCDELAGDSWSRVRSLGLAPALPLLPLDDVLLLEVPFSAAAPGGDAELKEEQTLSNPFPLPPVRLPGTQQLARLMTPPLAGIRIGSGGQDSARHSRASRGASSTAGRGAAEGASGGYTGPLPRVARYHGEPESCQCTAVC